MRNLFKSTALASAALLLMAAAAPAPAFAAKKLLRIVLDGPLQEGPAEQFPITLLLSGEKPKTLRELTSTFEKAAEDDDVAGIALIVVTPQMNIAQSEELIRAMKQFRDEGKKVYCYLDWAGNLSYMLAANADHITLAENSELNIVGLNASLMYFKAMLDKIGVEAEMLRAGDYKSAAEPFMRTEPSKEAAENINWLLDGLFERWLTLMAEGRGMSVEDMRAAVNSAPLSAEDALEHKLVDEVSSFVDFKRLLHKKFGSNVEIVKKLDGEDGLKIDFDNPFAIFDFFSKIMDKAQEERKPGLALIYIEGPIVVGEAEPDPFGGGTTAASSTIRAAIEEAREDDDIKAVVIRVDSPGGSALASDIMWKAATRCAAEKPLIVSMGGVAGSGGYYVAIPGDVIFAEASTITGSIGVLGGKFVWKELMGDKLGITITEFSRGERADLMSPNHQWSDQERAWMQGYILDIYEQFKNRVKTSRGDRIKGDLEQYAGGRVFTGQQALERGLVDRIGGLRDALDHAAEKADLGEDYEVHILPRPMDITEVFRKLMGEETEDAYELDRNASAGTSGLGLRLGAAGGSPAAALAANPLLAAIQPFLQQFAPEQARELQRQMGNLLILQRERAACFMPLNPTIR